MKPIRLMIFGLLGLPERDKFLAELTKAAEDSTGRKLIIDAWPAPSVPKHDHIDELNEAFKKMEAAKGPIWDSPDRFRNLASGSQRKSKRR